MASGSSRKSGSSASRKRGAASRSSSFSKRIGRPAPSSSSGFSVVPGTGSKRTNDPRRAAARTSEADFTVIHSQTIGDLQKQQTTRRREEALEKGKRKARKPLIILGVIVGLVIVGLFTLFCLSKTDMFLIEEVKFEGADHLTTQEVSALVSIPQGTTLLSVDTESIEKSLERDAWVQSVDVERIFPNTLEIVVHEREVGAIVEIPMGQTQTIQNWAIAKDGTWLMVIPSRESEIGSQLSQRIYDDAEGVLHITGVPYGLEPEIGKECTDDNVNNALEIISGMTTELADQVKTVNATDAESTLLTLNNNIEIAFGPATNIRDKERVCLQIMEDNPTVVYINVRVVDRPTWRAA